jgi:hypothetical protein
MLTYESAVHVERSPSTVWRYLVEPSNQVLWSDVPMRQLTDGPLTTGSRMEVSFGMGPIKAKVGLELTAVEPVRCAIPREALSELSSVMRCPQAQAGTDLDNDHTSTWARRSVKLQPQARGRGD